MNSYFNFIFHLTSARAKAIMFMQTSFRRIAMLFRQKKRWICEELVQYLLALNPVFYISVKRCVNGATAHFPFRDDNGKLLIDVYDRDAVCIDVDYMKARISVETIFVKKKGIESRDFPYIKEKIDNYISLFPKTNWNTGLKQLGEMREQLRAALCNSMGINFIRSEYSKSPSISAYCSTLSQEEKRRVCDVICNLDSDAIDITINFHLHSINAEKIYATLDQLALYDAKKEMAECEDEAENES